MVPFFERYPLFGRKLGAFLIFSELVELLFEKEHRQAAGLRKAQILASELSKHNSSGTKQPDPLLKRPPYLVE